MPQDIQIACRRVLRAPAFSVTVIAILALGVGATTAMVSTLDVLLWRPIHVFRPHELISVNSARPDGSRLPTPLRALEPLVAADLPVDGWCGYSTTIVSTDAGGTAGQAHVELVTGRCLRTIGVAPALGRWIEEGEAPAVGSGKPVALITHRYWQRMFAGDPQVLGRTLRIDNGTVSVIGLMPPGFTGLQKDLGADLIVPFNSVRPSTNVTSFIGRLRQGQTVRSVRAQLVSLWPSILSSATSPPPSAAQASPEPSADVQPLTAGFSLFRRLYSATLIPVTGLAGILLLLTCINVGGLLVARVAAHSTEISIMRALGAGSGRIARQLLAECVLLAACGCAIGVALAHMSGRAFVSLLPWGNLPWTISLTPDLRITSSVAALSVLLALGIAAVPMWIARRGTVQLRSDRTVARATSRWANVLLVGQLAATVVLVFACGLIVRSYTGLASVDRGFKSDRILSVRLMPNPGGHQNLDQAAYYPALVERIASLPGVQSVGFARYFGTINAQLPPQPVGFAGMADAGTSGAMEFISPRFFDTVGIPLHAGRDVAWSDLPSSSRVVIVSESLARALAPDGNVIGKVIRYGTNPAMQRLEIVGVAGNVSLGNYRDNEVRLVYAPAIQVGEATFATLHIRSDGDPMALVKPATDIVRGFAREHVQRASHVDGLFSNGLVPERMGAVVSTVAAVLALILSCLGIYALLAHSIARRTRELGIRIALGASPANVRGLVVGHALALVGGGLAIGVPAAIGGASVLRSLLYGVTATDGLTLAACGGLLIATGVVAALRPAARALRVDPACSLRAE